MEQLKTRRKRRRRPTFTPRFGPASVALELGLLRLTLAEEREEANKQDNQKDRNR